MKYWSLSGTPKVCNLWERDLPPQSIYEEELEDTKGAIRIRISKKKRQHNGQKKKYKRTNNDLQKKTYNTNITNNRGWTNIWLNLWIPRELKVSSICTIGRHNVSGIMSGSHLLDFEFPSTLSWVLLIMVSKNIRKRESFLASHFIQIIVKTKAIGTRLLYNAYHIVVQIKIEIKISYSTTHTIGMFASELLKVLKHLNVQKLIL